MSNRRKHFDLENPIKDSLSAKNSILFMSIKTQSALKRMLALINETRNIRDQIDAEINREGDTLELQSQNDRIRIKLEILVQMNFSIIVGILNIANLKEKVSQKPFYNENTFNEIFGDVLRILERDL